MKMAAINQLKYGFRIFKFYNVILRREAKNCYQFDPSKFITHMFLKTLIFQNLIQGEFKNFLSKNLYERRKK